MPSWEIWWFQSAFVIVSDLPTSCQYASLPMLSMQEVGDVSFVVEHGVGTFCNEHFKRLPRSLQTGLVPKLMSSSRLHKMHINLHNLMWFLNQCNAWMIWYTIRNALLDTKLLLIVAWSKAAASPFVHGSWPVWPCVCYWELHFSLFSRFIWISFRNIDEWGFGFFKKHLCRTGIQLLSMMKFIVRWNSNTQSNNQEAPILWIKSREAMLLWI